MNTSLAATMRMIAHVEDIDRAVDAWRRGEITCLRLALLVNEWSGQSPLREAPCETTASPGRQRTTPT
ncbi:hypothetical protein GCM10008997_37660 [Halomonas salifodinae]